MAKLIINNRFGLVPNELLNNEKISFKAKGIYAYIQSKPDNWNFSAKNISQQTKESVEAIRTGLIELENNGYLVRTKYNKENGLLDIEYTLYSEPLFENPLTDKPSSDKPLTDNQTTIVKKNSSKKVKSKKEESYNQSIFKIDLYVGSVQEKEILKKWVDYKYFVKKEIYETDAFISRFKNEILEFGLISVSKAIDLAIASEYKGYFPKDTYMPTKQTIVQPEPNKGQNPLIEIENRITDLYYDEDFVKMGGQKAKELFWYIEKNTPKQFMNQSEINFHLYYY